MTHIFNLGELDDFNEKINLDDLYEKKREHDLSKLNIFNKLLGRIHNKIKLTSRQKHDEQFCWFVVPEMMIGVPKYDQAAAIARFRINGHALRTVAIMAVNASVMALNTGKTMLNNVTFRPNHAVCNIVNC